MNWMSGVSVARTELRSSASEELPASGCVAFAVVSSRIHSGDSDLVASAAFVAPFGLSRGLRFLVAMRVVFAEKSVVKMSMSVRR